MSPQTVVAGTMLSNNPGAPIRYDATVLLLQDGMYNAFPGLARRSDGLHVVGYRVGASHFGAGDEGRAVIRTAAAFPTFGSEIEVAAEAGWDYRSCQPAWLSDGRLMVAVWRRIPGGARVPNGWGIAVSEDAGVTFSEPIFPTDDGLADSSIEGPVVELSTGDLVIAVGGEELNPGVAGRSDVLMASTDGGATWTRRGVINDGPADDRDYNEPNLIAMGDVLICVARDDNLSNERIQYVFRSDDFGATWAPVSSFDGSGAPHMCDIDGRIFVTYRSASVLNRNVARLSRDLGATWTDQYQIPYEGNCMYFAAVRSGVGTFNAVFAHSMNLPVYQANLRTVQGIAA